LDIAPDGPLSVGLGANREGEEQRRWGNAARFKMNMRSQPAQEKTIPSGPKAGNILDDCGNYGSEPFKDPL